jgi:hypothetical protein
MPERVREKEPVSKAPKEELTLPPILPGEVLKAGKTLPVKGLGVEGEATVVTPTLAVLGLNLKAPAINKISLSEILRSRNIVD